MNLARVLSYVVDCDFPKIGSAVTLTITAFSLEADWDWLKVVIYTHCQIFIDISACRHDWGMAYGCRPHTPTAAAAV